MTHKDYKAALERAQKELADLLAQQEQIEREILRRRRIIASLMEEGSDTDSLYMRHVSERFDRYTQEQSLTDDIRKIIRAAGEDGIAKELIRGELAKLGNGIDDHSNPAGTVNAIVGRLIEKGEAEPFTHPMTGYKTLRWKKIDPRTYLLGGANLSPKKKN